MAPSSVAEFCTSLRVPVAAVDDHNQEAEARAPPTPLHLPPPVLLPVFVLLPESAGASSASCPRRLVVTHPRPRTVAVTPPFPPSRLSIGRASCSSSSSTSPPTCASPLEPRPRRSVQRPNRRQAPVPAGSDGVEGLQSRAGQRRCSSPGRRMGNQSLARTHR